MASRGMPKTTQRGLVLRHVPAAGIAHGDFIARAPSAPMPVSITPSALGPTTRAAALEEHLDRRACAG
jgi:hypothetical protein